ncbi:MAG: hypothetical protein ACJASR_000741 [Psychroserpens sp.]|jgi:hypothetical protein
MKKLFFTAFICLIASIQYVYSQDRVVKLTGESIFCKVTEITYDVIKYKLDNESHIRNVSKEKIERIVFASGLNEEMNQKTVITGEDDWEKVQLVNLKSAVEGYKEGEILNTSVTIGWSSSNLEKSKNIAIKDFKKIAASKGYHIVYLTDTSVKNTGGVAPNKKRSKIIANITGLGYTYN